MKGMRREQSVRKKYDPIPCRIVSVGDIAVTAALDSRAIGPIGGQGPFQTPVTTPHVSAWIDIAPSI